MIGTPLLPMPPLACMGCVIGAFTHAIPAIGWCIPIVLVWYVTLAVLKEDHTLRLPLVPGTGVALLVALAFGVAVIFWSAWMLPLGLAIVTSLGTATIGGLLAPSGPGVRRLVGNTTLLFTTVLIATAVLYELQA